MCNSKCDNKCNCSQSTDFRNTCWIKTEGYKNCPMLYSSTLYRIFEDYRMNNKVNSLGFDSIKEYIMDTCNFDHHDWSCLKELYNSENSVFNKHEALKIQDSVPFQYTPEMSNIHLRWLY
jgi:hypothetical protein